MIAIVDYGRGNLHSVLKAVNFLGFEGKITSNPKEISDASHVILPGVGAFGDAVKCLEQDNLIETIKKSIASGKPFLGICLGMQLLFEKSFEHGEFSGLGIFKGEVVQFDLSEVNQRLKIPHMGWNEAEIKKENPIINNKDYFYFVHSFHAANTAKEDVLMTSFYGYEFVAAVARENVFAVQFHPEKSGEAGLIMIKKFCLLK